MVVARAFLLKHSGVKCIPFSHIEKSRKTGVFQKIKSVGGNGPGGFLLRAWWQQSRVYPKCLHRGVLIQFLINKAITKPVPEHYFDGIPVLYNNMVDNEVYKLFQDGRINGRGEI